jgi:predicted transcriptional regulator
MGAKRPPGALESAVLAELWAADGALSAEQVRTNIGGDLAYTTVQTILVRLFEKGAVTRAEAGRGFVYSPVLDDADLTARRMRSLLDREADRDSVLSRFVASLDPEDEAAVRRALEEGGLT